jgi:hypothetical protein
MAITTAMQTQVTELYVALFNRAPERDGLGYWVVQLDTVANGGGGLTIQQVAEAMYDTEPARVIYPLSLTDAQFVTNVYTFVLGRAPDAGGLAYWTARLVSLNGATGGNGHGAVVEEIIVAVNSYTGSDPVALESKALFQNKVEVGLYFAVTLLNNDVDTATYVNSLVTADPDSVDAVIASLGTVPNQPFALTATNEPTTIEGDAGTQSLVYNLSLDRVPVTDVTVNFQTVNTGTATPDDDFVSVTGTVTFLRGHRPRSSRSWSTVTPPSNRTKQSRSSSQARN